MGTLAEIFIKKETVDILAATLAKKTGEDAKGVKVQISISDTSNDYGQNVSAIISQTKEQREAKVKPFYVGNGKVFWTDGKISTAEKKQQTAPQTAAPVPPVDGSDLPFN